MGKQVSKHPPKALTTMCAAPSAAMLCPLESLLLRQNNFSGTWEILQAKFNSSLWSHAQKQRVNDSRRLKWQHIQEALGTAGAMKCHTVAIPCARWDRGPDVQHHSGESTNYRMVRNVNVLS